METSVSSSRGVGMHPLAAPLLVALIGSLLWLAAGQNQRVVVGPLLIVTCTFYWFFLTLRRRDGKIPFFDIGFICAGITFLYVALPTAAYLAAGLEWSVESDNRLLVMQTQPDEVGKFLWLSAAYFTSFAFTYVIFRGRAAPGPDRPVRVGRREALIMCGLLAITLIFQFAVELWYNVNFNPSNAEIVSSYGSIDLPLLVAQASHNVFAIGQIAKLGLIIFLLSRWQDRWVRVVLVFWLAAEVALTLQRLGARTYTAMLLMATMLMYHRLVKPFQLKSFMMLSAVFVLALLAYGLFRSSGELDARENVLVAASEFQVLMTTPIHLQWLIDHGIIAQIPWELLLSDLFMLIPQQFLSIHKIDPSSWYLTQASFDPATGLMFGVVSQALVGGGAGELFIRGFVLASVLAIVHRIYVRNGSSFLQTLFYLWLATVIYYTYRATTFYVLTYILYRFIPTALFFLIASALLRPTAGRVQNPVSS